MWGFISSTGERMVNIWISKEKKLQESNEMPADAMLHHDNVHIVYHFK